MDLWEKEEWIIDIESRLGEIRKNKFGTDMKIIEYVNSDNVTIKFLDEHGFEKNTTYSNFKNGCIKNPYDKIIFGVGYLGKGKYSAYHKRESDGKVRATKIYNVWTDMLRRCYYSNINHKQSTYYGICAVCEEWHNFQNFAQWYEENEYECDGRLHLDKDILFPNCKIYSPETCVLVSQRINMLFMNKPNKRKLPNGIFKNKKGYSVEYNEERLGTYKTLEEAYKIYANKKEEIIRQTAEEYKDIIPKIVYDALYAYKVDINNDKNWVA